MGFPIGSFSQHLPCCSLCNGYTKHDNVYRICNSCHNVARQIQVMDYIEKNYLLLSLSKEGHVRVHELCKLVLHDMATQAYTRVVRELLPAYIDKNIVKKIVSIINFQIKWPVKYGIVTRIQIPLTFSATTHSKNNKGCVIL